jgi:hypothetical protein
MSMPKKPKADPVTIGDVLTLAVTAAGVDSASELLKKVAELACPPNLADSEPTRETFLGHANNPDGKLKLITACHVLNYLDSFVPSEGGPARAHMAARALCYQVMRSERYRRFARLETHAAEAGRIEGLAGQYVLIRKDTGKEYLYEILILEDDGKKDTAPFATLLQQEVVHRGTWGVARKTLHCHLTGFMPDYAHDFIDLYLALEDMPSKTYGGFLAGLTTADGFPVVMPVIIVKFAEIHPSFSRLPDLSDQTARSLLKATDTALGGVSALVNGHFEEALKLSEIRPANIAIPVRRPLAQIEELITQTFKKFLLEDISGRFPPDQPTADRS